MSEDPPCHQATAVSALPLSPKVAAEPRAQRAAFPMHWATTSSLQKTVCHTHFCSLAPVLLALAMQSGTVTRKLCSCWLQKPSRGPKSEVKRPPLQNTTENGGGRAQSFQIPLVKPATVPFQSLPRGAQSGWLLTMERKPWWMVPFPQWNLCRLQHGAENRLYKLGQIL